MTATVAQVSGGKFDYIIIGGGTAGLALANRLSEDPSLSVLVLEAGAANLDDSTILVPGPGNRRKLLNNPKYDWQFKTIAQPHSNNRSYAWSRGKGLGGSSAINVLLWNKPSRDYLQAFEDLGNPGWNWEVFEKYSKRAERFVKPDHDLDILTYDMAYRGDSGKLTPALPSRTLSDFRLRPMAEALEKHGITHVTDSSSGFTNGSTSTALTLHPDTHQRSYAANMYYVPVASRQNLAVLVNAHVTKINSRSSADGTITAVGVEFLHAGVPQQVVCMKEVCLCAGAVMSPQILELSGIGDPDVLQKAGIDLKVVLPGVGGNVQEHLFAPLFYELRKYSHDGWNFNTYDPLYDPQEAMKQLALLPEGKGLFNLCTTGLTFVPLNTICADTTTIQKTVSETILAGIAQNVYPPGLRKQYTIQLKHLEQQVPSLELILGPGIMIPPANPDPTRKHITLGFGLNSPFSRGTIHVGSSDPLVPPVIDPHVFEESYGEYLTTMVELVKFLRRLAKTEPLKSLLVETEVSPGPQVESDEQIAEWIKNNVSTTFHTVGSCSMLPEEDGGVVDPQLRVLPSVYHTTNIRVVDLSIAPLQIGAHPQAMVYAIAEQAADIIKGVAA
ncbi:Dehydrogenase citC [Sparassis crispa]|uniref:Dehydrogenase citC n=1 Tax=Sparassis crispa TaxID=139825 RepID=A0A401G9X6_9APHY|nr:Dehydrogenase citC [Sparassis crispa]GBE78968.1 Dehydrogenase citC [Sparassis crispa]